jgi:ADP-L-glycero-D-manno-heptose 6-epimerase
VKDAVNMALHLAASTDANGLYNIGSGAAHTWLQLTAALFSAMAREPNIDFIDMPESMRDRYQYYTCADVARLRDTGFITPATPLSDAIADYVQQYLMHDLRLGDEAA